MNDAINKFMQSRGVPLLYDSKPEPHVLVLELVSIFSSTAYRDLVRESIITKSADGSYVITISIVEREAPDDKT